MHNIWYKCKQLGGITYSFIPKIKNNNDSTVNTNIFADKSYSNISAVIISTATLEDDYKSNNVVIFTNPLAKNKIKITDFNNFLYWKINKNLEYIPRINGVRQYPSKKSFF